MENVIQRIELLMFKQGRSQAWLGEAIGMPQSSVSRALRGEQRLYLDQAVAIAKALETSLDHLTCENPSEADQSETTHAPEPSPEEWVVLKVIRRLGLAADEAIDRLMRPPGPEIEVPPTPASHLRRNTGA